MGHTERSVGCVCEHGEEIGKINKKVDTILECLNGNGKPGLKTEMEVTKVRMRGVYILISVHLVSLIGILYGVFGMAR